MHAVVHSFDINLVPCFFDVVLTRIHIKKNYTLYKTICTSDNNNKIIKNKKKNRIRELLQLFVSYLLHRMNDHVLKLLYYNGTIITGRRH